jgi:hypothetical protein
MANTGTSMLLLRVRGGGCAASKSVPTAMHPSEHDALGTPHPLQDQQASRTHEVQTSDILRAEAPAPAVPEPAQALKLVALPVTATSPAAAAPDTIANSLGSSLKDLLGSLSNRVSSALSFQRDEEPSPLPPEIHRILTKFDDRLIEALKKGDIRLVRTAWLLVQSANYRLHNRQQLEALEATGVSPSPLLSADEGADLVRKGTRSAGAASHGWLMPGHPDPNGARFQLLRRELGERPYIEAIFFDYVSLYQGQRNKEQQAAFSRALAVMGDLYASAIGTTVLQIKEIPPRPSEYDGALALFKMKVTDESSIKKAFEVYGVVLRCEVGGHPEAKVFFSSHEDALKAKRAANKLVDVCGGIDMLYNERSYDGRRGEAGREDDNGRGW